jgi:hypothetical protein
LFEIRKVSFGYLEGVNKSVPEKRIVGKVFAAVVLIDVGDLRGV